jgi:uncharacterized repeat protein (TIGR01451 family)
MQGRTRQAALAACLALAAAPAGGAEAVPTHILVTNEGRTTTDALTAFHLAIDNETRTVDWEFVDHAHATPGDFPPDYLNSAVPLGIVLTTTGGGRFRVSAGQGSGVPLHFGDLDPNASAKIAPNSGDRLFTPLDGRTMSMEFFVAGTTDRAATRAVGLFFSGVEAAGLTKVELLQGSRSLGVFEAPVKGARQASFVGVVFERPIITTALVTIGGRVGEVENLAPINNAGIVDVVAMDDVLYAPLQPAGNLRAALTATRDGADVVYTASVRNVAAHTATGVELRQALPADVSDVSASDSPTVDVGGELVWEIGHVGAGGIAYRTVRVTPTAESLHPSVVSASSWSESEPDDDSAKLWGVPSAFAETADFPSIVGRLEELAAIAKTLGLPGKTGASLAASFTKARKQVLKAASQWQAGKTKGAASRLRAAGKALKRVGAVLDGRGARLLHVRVHEIVQLRTYALMSNLRNVPLGMPTTLE